MKIALIPIERVVPYARNPRKNEAAVAKVAASIREFGFRQPIVVDRNMVVVAGHTRLLAARQLGLKRVPVHVARELTPAQVKAYRLADNRTAEEAEWNDELLRRELADGASDPDEVPEPPEKPVTRPGDLWILGDPRSGHRVLCGDSTKRDDVTRLMAGERAAVLVTDPPYAVAYVEKARAMHRLGYGHSKGTRAKAIAGDEIDEERALALWRDSLRIARERALQPRAAWYVWHASGRVMRTFYDLVAELGLLHHQTLVWVKPNFVIGRCDYQAKFEPCFYGWVKGQRPKFYGERNQTSVWETPRDEASPLHPTQKPVAVFAPPFANHTRAGDIGYDPFLGSGTAVIAAERLGRRCYGLELEPRYCDLVVQRWEKFTGKKAKLESATRRRRAA